MYGYFTEEQVCWIKQNIEDKSIPQITEEYNLHFSTNINKATFRYRCLRDGLIQKKKQGGILEFTEEQDDWLRLNYRHTWNSIAIQFNIIFGTSFTKEKIRNHCRRYLHITPNLPRHEYQYQKPLYSRRYNAKDDCIEIKVCDTLGENKWVCEHHYVWEKANEMIIPKDHKIIHLDGDRTNNSLDNLFCVSNSVFISAIKQFNWDIKNKHYRLCALHNAQLNMLLKEE